MVLHSFPQDKAFRRHTQHSAADEVPPNGFPHGGDATLNFNHYQPYATASTCGIELTLPLYKTYKEFKDKMIVSLLYGGFGCA